MTSDHEDPITFKPIDVGAIPESLDRAWQKNLVTGLRLALVIIGKSKTELVNSAGRNEEVTLEMLKMMADLQNTCRGMSELAEIAHARIIVAATEAAG